jgi:integrase
MTLPPFWKEVAHPKLGRSFVYGRSVSGFSKAKARLDKIIAAELAEDQTNGTMPPWRLHDLRRSAASGMAQLWIAPHIIEKVLNHVSGSLAGVYNRFGYGGEKRHALESWAVHLQRLIDPPPQRRADPR